MPWKAIQASSFQNSFHDVRFQGMTGKDHSPPWGETRMLNLMAASTSITASSHARSRRRARPEEELDCRLARACTLDKKEPDEDEIPGTTGRTSPVTWLIEMMDNSEFLASYTRRE
jgi:hypothetical protein